MDRPTFPAIAVELPLCGAGELTPPLMAGTMIYFTSSMDQCACRHRRVAKCSNQLLSVSADLEADNI